ncbi:MAG TPA: hypothetical protein VLM11_19580 [Streptosporangiaceae bacterium]|nr:hypothetical protein [Streptosporangiaceae bacterium]
MTAPSPAYSACVRAAEARLPRGGVYVFAAWYAMSCAAFVWGAKPAAWFASVAVVAFAAAAGTTIWVHLRSGVSAFHADADGLRLGFGPAGAKSKRDLSWGDVQQLTISGLNRRVMIEVLVNASAAPAYRSLLRQFADLAFMFAVPVGGISRNTPALVVPRPDPARYRIPLIQVSAPEVHAALAQLGAETSIAALE